MATISDLWAAFEAFHQMYFNANPEGGVHLELWMYGGGCVTETESGFQLVEWDNLDEGVEKLNKAVQNG